MSDDVLLVTRRRRRLLCALLTVVAPLGAQQPAGLTRPTYAPTESAGEVLGKLDRWLEAMAASDSFAGVIAIAQAGELLLSRVAGMAVEPERIPNRIDTRFGLASVGKMFTAVAIGQLLEQGRLALSDTVGKFLPDYPNRDVVHRVTVAQLLTHTGGLGSFWNARYEARRASLFSLADYLPLFAEDTLLSPPGERWNYSNSGYLVLGRIIEVLSGMSYYDYLQRNIFDRAGMRNTGFYDRTGSTPNGAVGYSQSDSGGARHDNLGSRELRGASAGGGYSTASDMMRFMDALMKDRLLSQPTRVLFTSGTVDEGDGRNRYGYGFSVRSRGDTTLAIGHTGGFDGTTNQVFFLPRGGYTLVVLLNRSGAGDRAILAETGKAVVQLSGR